MVEQAKLINECDVAYAMSIIGGKWKMSIIWTLRNGPLRLSELRRMMPGVSESVLILQLKQLHNAQLVARKDYATVPPKVSYKLTPIAIELLEAIAHLEAWGVQHRTSAATAKLPDKPYSFTSKPHLPDN